VFDKTGTLTLGRPRLLKLEKRCQTPFSDEELLRLAAAVESPSEHPFARAIVEAAHQRGLAFPRVDQFAALPGRGVRGVVEGREVIVALDVEATCRIDIDGRAAGSMWLADALRPDARVAVDELRAMHLPVTMLSGDRRAVAETVGASLGIESEFVQAQQTPQSKAAFIADLAAQSKHEGGAVVMIGDGINDAAALAAADVGIALASGTNIAIESADIVIPGERVTAVPQTIALARATLRTIRQNLFFAFFYNVLAIPTAAFGLLGASGPLIAAAAMGLSDITVIGNALRLKRRLARNSPP
jgi:P-type E1-E2 ATPase